MTTNPAPRPQRTQETSSLISPTLAISHFSFSVLRELEFSPDANFPKILYLEKNLLSHIILSSALISLS